MSKGQFLKKMRMKEFVSYLVKRLKKLLCVYGLCGFVFVSWNLEYIK